MSDRVVLIKPSKDLSVSSAVRDLWEHRSLLWTLGKRDISVRFKQAVIGFAWVIVQPLASAAIFSVIFGVFANFDAGSVPYPFFVLSGMILWQFFSRSLTEGSGSLVANAHILTKVYFPRIILPLVPIAAASVDFLIASIVMFLLLLVFGVGFEWTVLFVPLVGVCAGLLAFGIALILAPFNALYRDIVIALPFLIQTLLFLTPIAYPENVLPDRYLWVLQFHPLATLVGLMRWAVFGSPAPTALALVFFFGIIGLSIALGARVMRRLEGTLVDRI